MLRSIKLSARHRDPIYSQAINLQGFSFFTFSAFLSSFSCLAFKKARLEFADAEKYCRVRRNGPDLIISCFEELKGNRTEVENPKYGFKSLFCQ